MPETVAEILLARKDDPGTAIIFEDRTWTYQEYVTQCVFRSQFIESLRSTDKFHVGVLLDNIPEYPMWLGACALGNATLVGINPTRRGDELARDISHTQCDLIVTDSSYLSLLEDAKVDPRIVINIDDANYKASLENFSGIYQVPRFGEPTKESVLLLIFTSGTSSAPKAVICSQGRLAMIGSIVAQMFELTAQDVCYCAMPLFHSNALMANWCPTISAASILCLRRKFSASGFLEDVRKYNVTYFNYVGKTLAYVLATQERPNDSDNPLIRGFGNEGTQVDVENFSRRFGCKITDAYGSTEGGAVVSRSDDTPAGALGPLPNGTLVLNPETGQECPRAQIDLDGKLLNPDEAIGEMVNQFGAASFEGYWNNDDATKERLKDGMYWTGDLAYVDESGFVYFAGRSFDWIRVDGENFAAAPIERIISRLDEVALCAVYAVPDTLVGDQVMVALELKEGQSFIPSRFGEFLGQQRDLGTKWAPKYVRVCRELPRTESNKVVKRQLRKEYWECEDPVYIRRAKDLEYDLLCETDIKEIRNLLSEKGRLGVLESL